MMDPRHAANRTTERSDWDAIYRQLRAIAGRYMRAQRRDHTLTPTALANEAYLRLSQWKEAPDADGEHLIAVAATAMRQILVNHARRRAQLKRGGPDARRIPFDDQLGVGASTPIDIVEINDALETLMHHDPRKGRIVELRFFAGLTVAQVAELMGLSRSTVDAEWRAARAWLLTLVSDDPSSSS